MANSVDPDEMQCSAASHLDLHCLLRPVRLNTYGKYGNACLFVALFYSGSTSLSTIFLSYPDSVWMWQGASMLSLSMLPH